MKSCENCKFCDLDCVFNEANGEEYLFYGCSKGNDCSQDFECDDFEEQEFTPYIEKDTKCDKCNNLSVCKIQNKVLDCATTDDARSHYVVGIGVECKTDKEKGE